MTGYYQSTKFNWDVTLKIHSSSAISRLVSPSHDIDVEFSDNFRVDAFVTLKEPGIDTFFENDFVVLFRSEDINRPMCLMQKLGDEYALMVSMLADLTPKDKIQERLSQMSTEVDLDNKKKYYQQLEEDMVPAEFYFLLDRSGSMGGAPMETAKEALILFLHSLPPHSKFNVISFGSDFESIFKGVVDYNQDTMEQACGLIKDFQANLGGTEIFAPLHSIFADRNDCYGLNRHVFLLTDGAVFDPKQ